MIEPMQAVVAVSAFPGSEPGIAAVEDEPSVWIEVERNGRQDRVLVFLGQEDLECVAREDDEVKLLTQSHRSRISLDPSDSIATWAIACNIQHGSCRINASDAPVFRERCRQLTSSAPQVKDGASIASQGCAIVEV
jgi:hypothetical protein